MYAFICCSFFDIDSMWSIVSSSFVLDFFTVTDCTVNSEPKSMFWSFSCWYQYIYHRNRKQTKTLCLHRHLAIKRVFIPQPWHQPRVCLKHNPRLQIVFPGSKSGCLKAMLSPELTRFGSPRLGIMRNIICTWLTMITQEQKGQKILSWPNRNSLGLLRDSCILS